MTHSSAAAARLGVVGRERTDSFYSKIGKIVEQYAAVGAEGEKGGKPPHHHCSVWRGDGFMVVELERGITETV
jgi:hypothetical protein